jgi:N-acyl homoserine lactone hydrolase
MKPNRETRRRRLLGALASACLLVLLGAYVHYGSVHAAPRRRFSLPAPAALTSLEQVFSRGRHVQFCTLATGNVSVPRSTMLRRDHRDFDRAREHEPFPIYAHLVRHPVRGDLLVDAGLDASFVNDDMGNFRLPARLVHSMLGARFELEAGQDTLAQLRRLGARPRFIFLTHVHGDHTAAIASLASDVRIVIGEDELDDPVAYLGYGHFAGRVIETLSSQHAMRLPPFGFAIDLFGDGSFYALPSPGHSRGHMSYLVNAVDGPVLLMGDAAHTEWAFERRIGPTAPTASAERVAQHSLEQLAALARAVPALRIVYGHEASTLSCDLRRGGGTTK